MATGLSHRTGHRNQGALPPQVSGFVGRSAELARADELLRRSRLVTITGCGGVGKTRLAVRAADAAAGGFGDGVHFADLSELRDPGLVAPVLAAGLALAGLDAPGAAPGPTDLDQLLACVRGRQLLLVLDTCEHLIDGCAEVAEIILREAPGVTILATSRQPLDAAGEATLVLGPLPVPGPGSDTAGQADAVELFAQRAAAAVPGFEVTPGNLADVIAVCGRLDGIPLAIELAALRLRALPLRQMAERIDDRLRLLTGGRRSGTPRHQTLRAAITWSYSLCTPAEQLLWARLSVFAGDFDIAAAEEVCAGDGLTAPQVVPAIISLVDKNVLVRCDKPDTRAVPGAPPPGLRSRMPGTMREFGAERLRDLPAATASAATASAAAAAVPPATALAAPAAPPPATAPGQLRPARQAAARGGYRGGGHGAGPGARVPAVPVPGTQTRDQRGRGTRGQATGSRRRTPGRPRRRCSAGSSPTTWHWRSGSSGRPPPRRPASTGGCAPSTKT